MPVLRSVDADLVPLASNPQRIPEGNRPNPHRNVSTPVPLASDASYMRRSHSSLGPRPHMLSCVPVRAMPHIGNCSYNSHGTHDSRLCPGLLSVVLFISLSLSRGTVQPGPRPCILFLFIIGRAYPSLWTVTYHRRSTSPDTRTRKFGSCHPLFYPRD